MICTLYFRWFPHFGFTFLYTAWGWNWSPFDIKMFFRHQNSFSWQYLYNTLIPTFPKSLLTFLMRLFRQTWLLLPKPSWFFFWGIKLCSWFFLQAYGIPEPDPSSVTCSIKVQEKGYLFILTTLTPAFYK